MAARYAVPTIYELQGFVDAGGLISYGPDVAALRRQVGIYTGKILKGAKLADLPIQQPTKFDLALNLKTAKGLGLTVPPSMLTRADVVIGCGYETPGAYRKCPAALTMSVMGSKADVALGRVED